MSMCLLKLLIFLSSASAIHSDTNFKDELKAIKDLVLDGNGKIGSFTPTTSNIDMKDLKNLENVLKPSSRKKRQNFNDEDKILNADIESTMKNIEIPTSKGNPAFSINAKTVYILYPSLFQDPNIFGRFSIPQNINMDSMKDEKRSPAYEANVPQSQPQIYNNNLSNYQPYYNPRNRRNADEEYPEYYIEEANPQQDEQPQKHSDDENQKRNVETHLSGTIVVLNQDVNEKNVKESY